MYPALNKPQHWLKVRSVLVELFFANCLFVKLRSYDTSRVINQRTKWWSKCLGGMSPPTLAPDLGWAFLSHDVLNLHVVSFTMPRCIFVWANVQYTMAHLEIRLNTFDPILYKPQHTPVVLLISNIDYRTKHCHCLRNIGFNAANFTHDNIP